MKHVPQEVAHIDSPGKSDGQKKRSGALLILHGASSVGKSYSLQRLSADFAGIFAIEMDDLIEEHISGAAPNFDRDLIGKMVKQDSAHAFRELLNFSSKESERAQRCIAFLLRRLDAFREKLGKPTNAGSLAVATCGALPFPRYHTPNSIYMWLEKWLNLPVYHLLLTASHDVHLKRIEMRDRLHLAEKIIANRERRMSTRDRYDYIASDYGQVREYVAHLCEAKIQPTDSD